MFQYNTQEKTTTSGMSYSYNLPQTYKGTTSSSYPCYKNLESYGACKGGTIIAPVPISLIPAIFYNTKPHAMPKKIVPEGQMLYNKNGYQETKMNVNNLKNCGNGSPYRVMPQTNFNCGGTQMDIESHFKKGFNDLSH